jgi:hypothetical protein
MRLRNLLGMLIVLMVTQVTVSGQEGTPSAPWPPDPEAIFEDGVQWDIAPDEMPIEAVTFDFERSVIKIFDAESKSWLEYPYPPGWDYVGLVTRLANGQIQIVGRISGPNYLIPEATYWLDVNTGAYSRPPTVCDDLVVKEEPEIGKWVVFTKDDGPQTLCHTVTGEQLDILPQELPDWRVDISPDQGTLVLMGRDESLTGDFQIWTYDFENQALSELGIFEIGSDEGLIFCGWISNTQGLLCLSKWPGAALYTFDTTQPDSIEYVFQTWGDAFLLEDLNRHATVQSEDYFALYLGSDDQEHLDCSLSIFDAAGLRTETLGYECLLISPDSFEQRPYFNQDNILYYLTKDSNDAPVSTLKSYDLEHESGNFPWLTAEIESILGASPDHRYIVLAMDDNQELGTYSPDGFQIAIWDFSASQIVYQSEPINLFYSSNIAWIDNRTVVMDASGGIQLPQASKVGEPTPALSPSSIRTIILNPDGSYDAMVSTQYSIEYPKEFEVFQQGCYLLQENRAVVDLYTYEAVPIIQAEALSAYNIHAYFHGADVNSLRVKITPNASENAALQPLTYKITLPDCTPQQP